jgi:predicted protein tyrosine phosphatase
MIHVCSLARLHGTVAGTGASHVITLLTDDVERPPNIGPSNHLVLKMDDILAPEQGLTAPAEEHAAQLIAFARGWDRKAPLVIHCFAGISRSTAAAFIAACALAPQRAEDVIARRLREASASATPNPRLISVADQLLCREGRMVAAVAAIGRGELASEGRPFALEIA